MRIRVTSERGEVVFEGYYRDFLARYRSETAEDAVDAILDGEDEAFYTHRRTEYQVAYAGN